MKQTSQKIAFEDMSSLKQACKLGLLPAKKKKKNAFVNLFPPKTPDLDSHYGKKITNKYNSYTF